MRHVTRLGLLRPAAVAAAAMLPAVLVGATAGATDAVAAPATRPTVHAVAHPLARPVALKPGDPSMPVAGELSTSAANTSTVAIPIPAGVTPTAVTAVVSQPEVVAGGAVAFSINGAPALSAPSALYQKVRIPVTVANVTVDRTIVLAIASQGAAVAGLTCVPTAGTAVVRKVALEYAGTEVAPTSVGDFFGPTAARIDVVIPTDASQSMIEAGLIAVDALAERYDDKTPVELSTTAPDPTTAVASQRVVSLVAGRAGEVTTAVSAASGVPTLALTGTGEELSDAARSLSSDALLLGGGQDQDPSTQMKSRSTSSTRTLKALGIDQLTLQGYGTTVEQIKIRQDDFGTPVDALRLHLVGSHTAFDSDAAGRLDVRANGALVGSAAFLSGSAFDLNVTIPAGRLQSVNNIDLSLFVAPPGGAACAAATAGAAEVDIDTNASTVESSQGTGSAEGFQLYPQVFEGTLPVALNGTGKQQIQSAIDAANLIVALQRAAASQLDIQVVSPDTFLADDRSGMLVGAVAQDSVNLDAPLRLSSTRRLDRADSSFAVTSQDPYAVLESIDRNDRFVLMLGSWAPGDGAAPGRLTRKVADAVVAQEWASLSGDLVLADDSTPAFSAASRSLKPHVEKTDERSYAGWFVAAIIVLLLLLAFQVVISIRRDRARKLAKREAEAAERRQGPAYVEDVDQPAATDDLGDVDDLEVTKPGSGRRPAKAVGPSGSGAPTAAPTPARSRLRQFRPRGSAAADTTSATGDVAETDRGRAAGSAKRAGKTPPRPVKGTQSGDGDATTPRRTTGTDRTPAQKRGTTPRKPRKR